MRSMREHPRLVAAKVALAFVALVVTVLMTLALASDGDDPPANLRARLQEGEQMRAIQARELGRARARVGQLTTELRATRRLSRARARARQRLRRELRDARGRPRGREK
jgi:hypothetical protein